MKKPEVICWKKINRLVITSFSQLDNLFELQQKLDSIIADIIKIVENQDSYHMNIISLGIAFTGAIDNVGKKIVRSHNLEYLSDRPLNTIIYPNRLDFFEQKVSIFTLIIIPMPLS